MYFKDEYGNFGFATTLLNGMTEISKEEYDDFFIQKTSDQKLELQLQKARIEAELAALEQEETESGKDEQQMIVEEQASLLGLKARPEALSAVETAYIENRLDSISSYWNALS